VKFLLDLLFNN